MQELMLWYAVAMVGLGTTAVCEQLTVGPAPQAVKSASGGGLVKFPNPKFEPEKSAVQWDLFQLTNAMPHETDFDQSKNDCMEMLKSTLFHPVRNSSKSLCKYGLGSWIV